MSHIAHLRKQFKSIIIMLIKGRKTNNLLYKNSIVHLKLCSFEQTSLFRDYFPLKKGGNLHLNTLESPQPKDALCQVWLKLAQWV